MKKNSSLILIVILLALIGFSLYIYKSKSKLSTIDGADRNFNYKDTASITKIFIADHDGHKVTLTRGKTNWIVNNKYNCRRDAILNLMEVIKNVEVKMPVGKAEREAVIKFMATNSFKVEIYSGDELIKQFYLGHETPDSQGSYMLLTDNESGENYKNPYVCFIPGFKGYLMPRFIVSENEWRDRLVINFTPPQIREISVFHLNSSLDSSFTIQLENTANFKLKNGRNQELPFDALKMKQYLAYFQNISYEVLITGKTKRLQDSLSLQQPFSTIKLVTDKAEVKTYNFYRKYYDGVNDPEHGVNLKFDPDHFYMRFDADKEWALVQYYVFGKLLITPTYFLQKPSVKK